MLISVQAEKTACGPQSTAARTRGRAQTRSGAGSPVPNKSGAIVVLIDEDGEVRPQMVQIAIRGRVDLLPL